MKLVLSLFFLCTAIMTSSIIYKINHPDRINPVIDKNIGLILPTPRDLNTFDLLTQNNKPFRLNNFYQHWTLVFFGFTHCASICPATLGVLNPVYKKLIDTYPNLQIALISLDPERDTPADITRYTHSFNPAFIGVTGKLSVIRKLQSQLGVYAERDPQSPQSNYQIMHTASIMLINPKGQWIALFKSDSTPSQLIEAIQKTIKSESSRV